MNKITYKIVYPDNHVEITNSLKETKKHGITQWLEKRPYDAIEVYRGKKLYSTFLVVRNKVVGVRW